MLKIKNLISKTIVSCICLGSAYVFASPAPANQDKTLFSDIAAKTPGTLLSIKEQTPDLFTNASQRFLINYRSRGVNAEPIVTSVHPLKIMWAGQYMSTSKLPQRP